jgi:broad specificity phosphatase PhoE
VRIAFARHGQSEANVLREISNRGHRHGLTELGREQSMSLAQKLGDRDVTMIYASPLLRAVETAEILSATLRVPFETTDALREFDCGIAEGRADAEAWALHAWLGAEWFDRGRPGSKIDGGESMLEIQARFLPWLAGVVAPGESSSDTIVCVGHGGIYSCVLPMVIHNLDLATFSAGLGNAGYALAETGPGGLELIEWNSTNLQ